MLEIITKAQKIFFDIVTSKQNLKKIFFLIMRYKKRFFIFFFPYNIFLAFILKKDIKLDLQP